MCMCQKPNVNGRHGYQWDRRNDIGTHSVNPPQSQDYDELLADEPGRCGHGIDSHELHFQLVRRGLSNFLLVKHCGGEEEIHLGIRYGVTSLRSMDSDARYWMLQMIYHLITDEKSKELQRERTFWRKAIADNRVKKRKVRNSDRVDVWVLSADSQKPLSRSIG